MPRLFHTADLHLGLKFTRGGYPPALRDELVARRIECLRGMLALATAGNARSSSWRAISSTLRGFRSVSCGKRRKFSPGSRASSRSCRGITITRRRTTALARVRRCPRRTTSSPPPRDSVRPARPGRAAGAFPRRVPRAAFEKPRRRVGRARPGLAYPPSRGSPGRSGPRQPRGTFSGFRRRLFSDDRRDLEATAWTCGSSATPTFGFPTASGSRATDPLSRDARADGFDCRHDGHAWILELAEDGTVSGESVRTGRHRFHTLTKTLTGETSLEELRADFASFDPARDLVKLSLSGRIPGAHFDSRGEWLAELEKSVLYLETDLPDLMREITPADIGREFTTGSFPPGSFPGSPEPGATPTLCNWPGIS